MPIAGMGRQHHRFVIILDVERVLSLEDIAAVWAAVPEAACAA